MNTFPISEISTEDLDLIAGGGVLDLIEGGDVRDYMTNVINPIVSSTADLVEGRAEAVSQLLFDLFPHR